MLTDQRMSCDVLRPVNGMGRAGVAIAAQTANRHQIVKPLQYSNGGRRFHGTFSS